MKKKIEVEKSSGNIFRDLEMPDPEEHLAKCRLVFIIDDIITKRRLRRSKAAKILGIRNLNFPIFRTVCFVTFR